MCRPEIKECENCGSRSPSPGSPDSDENALFKTCEIGSAQAYNADNFSQCINHSSVICIHFVRDCVHCRSTSASSSPSGQRPPSLTKSVSTAPDSSLLSFDGDHESMNDRREARNLAEEQLSEIEPAEDADRDDGTRLNTLTSAVEEARRQLQHSRELVHRDQAHREATYREDLDLTRHQTSMTSTTALPQMDQHQTYEHLFRAPVERTSLPTPSHWEDNYRPHQYRGRHPVDVGQLQRLESERWLAKGLSAEDMAGARILVNMRKAYIQASNYGREDH